MRIAIEPGCRLYVDVESPGLRADGPQLRDQPTLVMIHGGPGFDHASFRHFFPRLGDAVQIVYYDHRGMGRSDGDDSSRWTLRQWADDLQALLGLLEIRRPILFGQSFGGFVALEYATRRLGELSGVVLSSTAPRMVAAESLAMFEKRGGATAMEAAAAYFNDPTLANFDVFRDVCMPCYNTTPQDLDVSAWTIIRPEVTEHFWRGEHLTMDYRDAMSAIECPVEIFVGTEDPITPVARAREMAQALGGRAGLRVVDDAGHGVFRDKPEMFEKLLREFIARCHSPSS